MPMRIKTMDHSRYLSGSHELSAHVHFDGRSALAGNLRHLRQSSH